MSDKGVDNRAALKQVVEAAEPGIGAPEAADRVGVSEPTARHHLKKLFEDGHIQKANFGGADVYYTEAMTFEEPDDVDEELGLTPDDRRYNTDGPVGIQLRDVVETYTDRFMGLDTAPWTAIHPNDGPAEAGDRIQLLVNGIPGYWSNDLHRVHGEESREHLTKQELSRGEANVLLSGTLYAKPTAPIEHRDVPDDYDLEQRKDLSPWLFEPCNNAVFLEDVEVDWISPIGYPRPEPVVI